MNLLFQTLKKKIGIAVIVICSFFLPSKAEAYTINSVHANLTFCDTMTRGIFIIWWDKDFSYSPQANVMLDSMLAFRTTCLNDLGMQDPLNAQNGYYCNIYIYTPGATNDFFTVNYPSWGNGVGGDANGYPFMTLPNFVCDSNYAGGRWRNLAHETFHIFQSHGMWDITPGIYNTDDGGWFVEASASWFSYNRYPNSVYSFGDSEILVHTPHVPIWLGWANLPTYYPNNWQRQVHQYALATYLYYLTNNAGILDSDLVSIFYSGTTLTPKEYMYNQIGGAALRKHFIDCAAHMTNNYDFILPSQHVTAKNEYNTYADPLDNNQYTQTYTNTGSGGWYKPHDSLTTNAWSFNTYRLLNTNSQAYTFEINGDALGTNGDSSYFQGKVLVRNSTTGSSFHDLVMSNSYQGSLTLNLTPNDTAVYFIIASMPKIFEDINPIFQLYPYQMRISAGATGILEPEISNLPKFEIARYNLLGQKINKNIGGFQIIFYNDGSTKKVFVQR